MATSAEIGLAALGAFAASEATGVTDVTGLGGGGGDEGGDSGGGGSSPGLGALASRVASLQGSVAAAVSERPSGGVDQTDLADAFGQLAENAATPNQNVRRTVDTVSDAAGDLAAGEIPTGGGGTGGTNIPRTAGGLLTGLATDPGGTGTAIGEGAGEFLQGTTGGVARGVGGAVGTIPFAVVDGAVSAGQAAGNETRRVIADVTGVEGSGDTGINDDRPGAGITDVLSAAAQGEQTGPVADMIRSRADAAEAQRERAGGLSAAVDAADTSDAAASNTRDLAERIGEFIPDVNDVRGAQLGPGVTGPVDAGGESAQQAASAVATAGGGDAGPMDDTTSTGDTTRERDRENRDELDDVRRAAAAGRRRIGVVR